MRFQFHQEALLEYEEAALFYKDISSNLAIAFITSVEEGIEKILEYPDAWQEVDKGIRRYLIKRFPYGIYYTIERDHLIIIAVMHMSRKPGYWQPRLQEIGK